MDEPEPGLLDVDAQFPRPRRVETHERPVVVIIFCDGGERYLSDPFWDVQPVVAAVEEA